MYIQAYTSLQSFRVEPHESQNRNLGSRHSSHWTGGILHFGVATGNRSAATPPNPASFSADSIAKGEILSADGHCVSCHVRAGGQPLAGGYGVNTPFGLIYGTNITPDTQTGISSPTEMSTESSAPAPNSTRFPASALRPSSRPPASFASATGRIPSIAPPSTLSPTQWSSR